jgi:electron transport complex protein RnfC
LKRFAFPIVMDTSVDEPPKPAPTAKSRFRRLDAIGTLLVPCPGIAPGATLDLPTEKDVRRGQPLLGTVPAGSVQVFAPVDGKIAGTGSAAVCGSNEIACILLKPDAESQTETPAEDQSPKETADETFPSLPAIADRLSEMGVWGDRWASPDLRGQLRGPHRRPIDTIFCNALDESMEVPLQASIAAEHAASIAKALLALAAASGASRVQIIVGFYTPAALMDSIRAGLTGTPIRLTSIRNDYPQPSPILLIHELTGRHVRWGELPTDHGVLILDAAAAALMGRALAERQPMLSMLAAVHDYSRSVTHLISAPVGVRLADLLSQLQIEPSHVELRAGSPLRQIRLSKSCVVGGGELCLSASLPESKLNPDPCIRCAWCVEGCPVRIRPAALLDAAQHEDVYGAKEIGLDACIECGICSYVCPSNLPLLKGIRSLRSQITVKAR